MGNLRAYEIMVGIASYLPENFPIESNIETFADFIRDSYEANYPIFGGIDREEIDSGIDCFMHWSFKHANRDTRKLKRDGISEAYQLMDEELSLFSESDKSQLEELSGNLVERQKEFR